MKSWSGVGPASRRTWHPCVALWLSGAAFAFGGEPENRLRNGDFEAGGKGSVNDWATIYPPSLAKPKPEFTVAPEAHAGERAGSIDVRYEGGFTSYTQSFPLEKSERSVHFEAYGRIDGEPSKGAACIQLWFTVPGSAEGGESVMSKRLTTEREWTRLAIDVSVPEGATELVARCGVLGPCRASFDDARLFVSERQTTGCKLAVAHGDYAVDPRGSGGKPWIEVSIPFALGGQTPLAIRVTSEPDGKVAGLALEKDRENRPLKILLRDLQAGVAVKLRVETLVLLRDRTVSDGKGVPVTAKAKIPKDVKPHLEKAPGIDVEDAAIRKRAATLAKQDFGGVMTGVAKLLRDDLEYAGGESQGASECLGSGKAVCTGYANVGASLLIAAGVPARILACATLGSRLQEHYIVEAWTEKLGWSRMESTAAMFPWKDSENVVLRIVYPDAERSPFDVPLFQKASSEVASSFRMGDDGCWQGAEVLESCALEPPTVAAIEAAARPRFEELAKRAASAASVAFLFAGDPLPADAGAVTAVVTKTVSEWGAAGR